MFASHPREQYRREQSSISYREARAEVSGGPAVRFHYRFAPDAPRRLPEDLVRTKRSRKPSGFSTRP